MITAASALAFAVLIGADLLLIYLPELPRWFGIAIIVAALWGDVEFTQWYPESKVVHVNSSKHK